MKTPYIKKLYDDANIKAETIQKYIDIFQNKLKDSINSNVDYIKKYEELFTQYQKIISTNQNVAPREFAIEVGSSNVPNEQQNSAQASQDSAVLAYSAKAPQILKDLSINAPLISYNFEALAKNLQYLQVALQNYQALIVQIENAWKSLLNL